MANLQSGLVSIQLKDVDVSSKEALSAFLTALTPAIIENIMISTAGDRSRGCGASAGISVGPGGISGTGTITCTF